MDAHIRNETSVINLEKDEKEKQEEKVEVKGEDSKFLSKGEIVTVHDKVLIRVLLSQKALNLLSNIK